MTLMQPYECPECKQKTTLMIPFAVLEKGKIKSGYVQHVCQNDECQYRQLEKVSLKENLEEKASGQNK